MEGNCLDCFNSQMKYKIVLSLSTYYCTISLKTFIDCHLTRNCLPQSKTGADKKKDFFSKTTHHQHFNQNCCSIEDTVSVLTILNTKQIYFIPNKSMEI